MRVAYLNRHCCGSPRRETYAPARVVALPRALRALGCEVVDVDARWGADVERALDCAHRGRALDAVYERYVIDSTAGARFAERTGVPLLLEVDALHPDGARERLGLDEHQPVLECDVIRAAAHVFAPSSSVADDVARHGLERARIHVSHDGVDTDVFRPGVAPPTDLSLPSSAFVLGVHGRPRPWHDFRLLGDVLARLVARGYPAHVLAIGAGDIGEHFPPRVQAAHVTVLPQMDEPRLAAHVACFDAMPLCCTASCARDAAPLELLEAMACGAVPLVPNLGDLPRVVELGASGMVYSTGDAVALANAIAGLIEWPEARERLSAAATRRAQRRTWLDVAREVLEQVVTARVA